MNNLALVVVALRRVSKNKNENIGLTKKCIRKVVRSTDSINDVVLYIKDVIKDEKGLWRIYVSQNRRNLEKAKELLMIDFILNKVSLDSIDSHWKSILMKKACKAERNILIDIDSKSILLKNTIKALLDQRGRTYIIKETPNGYHFLCKNFDSREIEKFNFVEIKKDGLFFLESVGE